MPTHKKAHDKDKYYHLAKDQGYRARSAFKLIQINKRFNFLAKARVCIDLCAAPGGWCQVAAKAMAPGSIILGVDLLPIRDIRNVKTIVQDITTAECRKQIVQELQGWKADVVLHDGAPNIGSAYTKDAYVQNELVLASLRTATDHLVEKGVFCTKIYRSSDYNSLMWVFQQLFEEVQAMKPNSSRSQSAEIFVVCTGYLAPSFIDPKLLDPNHVFKEATGADANAGQKSVDVLHKKFDQVNKRHRSGYDESLGVLLTASCSVSDFVDCQDPVRKLTDVHKIVFTGPEDEHYKSFPQTTPEILESFQDLRILGKIDFKKIVRWRQAMRKVIDDAAKVENDKKKAEETSAIEAVPLTEEEKEQKIQDEISALQDGIDRKARKEQKKVREQAAKQRERQALGMSYNHFEGAADEEDLFSSSVSKLLENTILEVDNLMAEDDEDVFNDGYDARMLAKQQGVLGDHGVVGGLIELNPTEEDLEDQLEEDYNRYVMSHHSRHQTKKLLMKEAGKKQKKEDESKESSVLKKGRVVGESSEATVLKGQQETADILDANKNKKKDVLKYANMLGGEDESDSEDEEGYKKVLKHAKAGASGQQTDAQTAHKADQWFSHPIFDETLVSDETVAADKEPKKQREKAKKKKAVDSDDDETPYSVGQMMDLMPKTDKILRSEKRKKDRDRREAKEERAAKRLKAAVIAAGGGEDDGHDSDDDNMYNKKKKATQGFKVVPSLDDVYQEDESSRRRKGDEAGIKKQKLANEALIKKGMGRSLHAGEDSDSDNEDGRKGQLKVVSNDSDVDDWEPEVFDDRDYDSDHEVYDAHDKAMTLALGTMMLRKSRQKAMVDASYNRYAWNDPSGMPAWFLDDEARHNKPQLPVPNALLDQIKNKFQSTGVKDIKKVAEARMRKRKRAMTKLKAAKKQANLVAENSEMSEREKLKAISKAMRSSKIDKPGKVYAVCKKTSGGGSTGTKTGGKGGKIKFVDKLMKKERRAQRSKKKRDKKFGKH